MTLTEFLLARIDEDVEAAIDADWAMQGKWYVDADDKVDEYVRRVSPARVVAECEAKRRIVKIHTEGLDDFDGSELYSTGCDGCRSALWPCPTILALILPYADHPDYQPEWKL